MQSPRTPKIRKLSSTPDHDFDSSGRMPSIVYSVAADVAGISVTSGVPIRAKNVRHDTHEIFHQESSKPIVEAVTEGLCEKERQALVHRLPGESSESYYDRLTAADQDSRKCTRKKTEEYFRALEAMTRKDLTTIGKLELLGLISVKKPSRNTLHLVYMSFTPTAEGQEEFLSHMPEIYNEISDGNAIYTLKNHST